MKTLNRREFIKCLASVCAVSTLPIGLFEVTGRKGYVDLGPTSAAGMARRIREYIKNYGGFNGHPSHFISTIEVHPSSFEKIEDSIEAHGRFMNRKLYEDGEVNVLVKGIPIVKGKRFKINRIS